jgi:DNA polymerase elongation subunit (family B)
MALVFHLLDIQSRDQTVVDDGQKVIYEPTNDDLGDSDEEFQTRRRGGGRGGRGGGRGGGHREFVIHLFGKTADGRAVRVDAVGFRPTFYIALPTSSSNADSIDRIQQYMRERGIATDECTFQCVMRESFFGFNAKTKRAFLEITFASLGKWREARALFLNDKMVPEVSRAIGGQFGHHAPEIFEANIDPMLRFLHSQNLQPCGWVQISDGLEAADDDDGGILSLSCDYDLVELCTAPPRASAQFIVASWDIECYSATGEFPIAKKDGAWINLRKALEKVVGKPVEMREAIERLIEAGVFSVNRGSSAATNLERALASIGAMEGGIEEVVNSVRKWLEPHGDPVIQIGVVLTTDCKQFDRHLFVWPACDKWNDATVHSFHNERTMIAGFFKWLAEINPDILLGYNVFGFDEKYLWERGQELGCLGDGTPVHRLNRLFGAGGGGVKLEEKFLSSSAMGDNYLYMWSTQGRLQIDLYHYVRRNVVLPSYKLDEVTKNFMSGKLKGVIVEGVGGVDGSYNLVLNAAGAVKDVRVGRAICLLDGTGESLTDKMVVESVDVATGKIVVKYCGDAESLTEITGGDAQKWVVVKDDVSPQDIFRLHRGSSADRAVIGRYCLQDCDLVLELYKKLEVFNNAMSMANVCTVPVNYIFVRGQGIKAESLIFKICRQRGILIPVLPAPRQPGEGQEDSYEGAIVLDPEPGFYCKSPIGVADFASLYPSTIESENISHDSLVWVKDYDYNGRLICVQFGSDRWDGLTESYGYTDIEFDIWRPDPADKRKHPEKIRSGRRVCRYAQPLDGTKSTLPEIIRSLLAARKAKRKEAEKETDPERKALLDAEQLAYKLTGNSLYGQLGSGTFKIRLQHLAASVTGYGRKQIMAAKAIIERFYGDNGRVHMVGTGTGVRCSAKIMYGDTDSLFVEFNPVSAETGAPLEGRAARQAVIDLTAAAGKMVTKVLKPPHDFEFDKIFDPMLMFSKKRYAGLMYEENADDFVYKYMGIALKRRDNAPIVKTIFGAAMKKLLLERDVAGATALVKTMTADLVAGKVSLGQLTITKSLRGEYADPSRIAHKALADRIAARDPGNAPASGDRIGFVYVKPGVGQVEAKLQGDRIETPTFVKANGLMPDYRFYIEHQLQNPISQMFGIVLEQMPGFSTDCMAACPMDKEKAIGWRENVAAELLFDSALHTCSADDKTKFFSKYFGGAKKIVGAITAESNEAVHRLPPKKQTVSQQKQISMYVLDSIIIDNIKKDEKDASLVPTINKRKPAIKK